MIDLSKEYQTEHGQKVKLMGINDGFVVGLLMYTSITPSPMLWHLENGKCETNISLYDLVEVKPIIEHSAWVNVYEYGFGIYTYTTEEKANENALEGRIDCIEIKYSNK